MGNDRYLARIILCSALLPQLDETVATVIVVHWRLRSSDHTSRKCGEGHDSNAGQVDSRPVRLSEDAGYLGLREPPLHHCLAVQQRLPVRLWRRAIPRHDPGVPPLRWLH